MTDYEIRQRNVEQVQAVVGLRVYKIRNGADDGWLFFTARSLKDAKGRVAMMAGGADRAPECATFGDLQVIACRALSGAY